MVVPRTIDPSHAAAALLPVGVFVALIALIVPTVMPGVGFWDTAEAQTVPPVLGVMHPTGFPSYVLVGWIANALLAPLGEPAFRMNLLSAVSVAGAGALTAVLVRQLTGAAALGVAAGIGLALTPIAWGIATHADVHALHVVLLAALLVLLVEWARRHAAGDRHAGRWLVAASVAFAVAAANHSLTLLLPPAIGLYVLAVDPRILRQPRLVLACAVAIAVTLTVLYLELPLRGGPFRASLVYGRPETWEGFRYIVLAEQFRGSVVDPFGNLTGKVRELVDLTVAQTGILAPLVPFAFLATVRRAPHYALLTGVATLTTVFFAASYVNADIGRYYLGPALMAWTWLAILAATVVEVISGPEPSGASANPALAALMAIALLLPTAAALPDRAASVDLSRERTAERWLDAAVAAVEDDAVVVSWWSFSTTLWYAQHIEGRLHGVDIIDDRTRLDLGLGEVQDVIDAHLGTRPVYVIRAHPADVASLREHYELRAVPGAMTLYRVVPGGGTAASGERT